MGAVLKNGFVYFDGLKYVLQDLSTLEGPPGPPGEQGNPGPPGSGGVGIGNALFVSKLGNDTTGDGSFDNPYLTVLHANTVLKNKTLPPNSQLWTILIGNGTYNENISILPNASYLGFDVSADSTIISGNHTLDASWTGYGVSQSFFGALTFSAGLITANFAAVSNDSQLSFFACQLPINVSATGIGSGNTNLSFELCKNVSGEVSITNGKIQSQQTNFSNSLTIAGATGIASWISSGSDVVADLILNGNTGFATSANINGGSSVEALTLNGVLATYNSPIGSIPTNITFTNTATASQITIVGELPVVNIVPSTTDGYVITTLGGQAIWAPSAGGGGGGIGVGLNVVFVSSNGSDTTGLGTLASPFATYAHSIGVIGSSATSSNLWSVQFGPGSYNENISLAPWITITGFDAVGSTILNGTVGLASSFIGSTRKLSGISNTTINNSVNFNFAGVGSTGGQIQLTQCFIRGSFTSEGNGTVNNTLTLTECVISGGLTITDLNLVTQGTTINGSINVSAPSFGASWNGFESTTTNCFVDGSAGRNANVDLAGSMVNGLLQLKGGLATYTSTISGIPASVSLISGAVIGQYNINGNLPVGNIGANGITDGYVITSRSGLATWSPAAGGSGAGGPSNILYVALNGNDTTGNGTFLAPFATYAKCVAVIGGVATVTSAWTIQFAPGVYTEAMVLAPWIFIAGDTGQTTQFFGSMALSSAFLDGSNETGGGVAFVEFEFSATVDFDFASIHAVNSYLAFNYVTFPTTFSVEGNGSSGTVIFFESCGIENNVTISDISVGSLYTNWAGGLTLSAISSAVGWISDGDTIDGNILFNGNAGHTVSAILNGTSVIGGLTLNGTLATYTATIGGIPGGGVTLLNSASINQYVIEGQLPIANLAPSGTNGWVATTVGGHATWAAPSGGGGGGPANIVFVATNGDDGTGNGSFTSPFATYGKAVSAIGIGATSTPWLVVFGPGVYVENILLANNISLTTWDPAAISASTTGTISLGPSFTSAAACSVSNFAINGAASFVFNGSVVQTLTLDGIALGASLTASGGGISNTFLNVNNCPSLPTTIFTDLQLNSSNTKFASGITVNATANTFLWHGFGGAIEGGGLVINGNSGHTCTVGIHGISNTILTLNGINSFYTSNVNGVPNNIVLQNGATLTTNYSILGELPPVNVAPYNSDGYVNDGYVLTVSNSGISKWMPSLSSSGGGLANILYVSLNGSDITGNGSLGNPFTTYARCVAAIGSAATAINPYSVQFAPGNYTENILLASYITIDADDVELVFFNGTTGLGTSFAGSGFPYSAISNVAFNGPNVPDFNFPNQNGTVILYNCDLGGTGFTAEGVGGILSVGQVWVWGGFTWNVTIIDTAVNFFAGATVANGEGGSIVVNSVSFDAYVTFWGGSVLGNITLNGNAGHTAEAFLSGSGVTGNLTLNGTNATYQATIGGIPGGGVTLLNSASINQYVIEGQLPPANIQPSTTDGYVLTTVSGGSQWAPPSGGGGGGGSVTLIGDTIGGPGTTIATTTQLINHASVPVAGALTTGNVLRVSGLSALTYSALNLAGGSGWVTGNLPITNIAPGTNGQILTTSGGTVVWSAPGAGGGISNVLYVAKNGSDTIGNGTFQSPFATYGKCVTAIGGLATASNPYTVVFGPGQYAESPIALAPFINLMGFDATQTFQQPGGPAQTTVLSGLIGFNGSSFTGANDVVSLCNVHCSHTGASSVSFNFATGVSQSLNLSNVTIDGSFAATGSGSGAHLYLVNVVFNGTTNVLQDLTASVSACLFSNDVSVVAVTAASHLVITGGACLGTVHIIASSGPTQGVQFFDFVTTVEMNGVDGSLAVSIGGIPLAVTYINSATAAQYTVFGHLPPANVDATGITNSFVLTASSGVAVWAAPTGGGGSSNGIGQLTTDVTTPAASAPDQTLAATVVQAQNGKIVFGISGLTTWSSTATFGLVQAATTGTIGANALWEPQQSTNSGNGTGGLALINLQVPLGSGSESQLWVTRGAESNPRFAAGTIGSFSNYGMAWVANGSTPISSSNYFVLGDGISVNAFNGPNTVAIVINGVSYAQVNTTAGTQFGASGGATNFGGGVGVLGLSPATSLPTLGPSNGLIMAVNSFNSYFNLYGHTLGSVPFITMAGDTSLGFGNAGLVWLGQSSQGATNFSLASNNSGATFLNATTIVEMMIGGTAAVELTSGSLELVPTVNFGVGGTNYGGGGSVISLQSTVLPSTTLVSGNIVMASDVNGLHLYQSTLGNYATIGTVGSTSFLWLKNGISTQNYALACDGSNMTINVPTGSLNFAINGADMMVLNGSGLQTINGISMSVGGFGLAIGFGGGVNVLSIANGTTPGSGSTSCEFLSWNTGLTQGLHAVGAPPPGVTVVKSDDIIVPSWQGSGSIQPCQTTEYAFICDTNNSTASNIGIIIIPSSTGGAGCGMSTLMTVNCFCTSAPGTNDFSTFIYLLAAKNVGGVSIINSIALVASQQNGPVTSSNCTVEVAAGSNAVELSFTSNANVGIISWTIRGRAILG